MVAGGSALSVSGVDLACRSSGSTLPSWRQDRFRLRLFRDNCLEIIRKISDRLGGSRTAERLLPGLALVAFLVIVPFWTPGEATVVNTKHNLTAARPEALTDSTEVCAYCHTPIGNSPTMPRWDRSATQTSNVFSTYDSFGRSNLGADDPKAGAHRSVFEVLVHERHNHRPQVGLQVVQQLDRLGQQVMRSG